METDREILIWFHQRLVNRHNESHLYDYMHRLRWIIQATNPKKVSRGHGIERTCNNTQELSLLLKNKTNFEIDLLKETK